MTYMNDQWIEEYIKGLSWAEGTPDEMKTVVCGNLRGLYNALMGKIEMDVLLTMQSAFLCDPVAMRALTINRVPCNQELADHTHVVVQQSQVAGPPRYEVGVVGIIVGIMDKLGCKQLISWSFDKVAGDYVGDDAVLFSGFKLVERAKHPGSGPAVPAPQ